MCGCVSSKARPGFLFGANFPFFPLHKVGPVFLHVQCRGMVFRGRLADVLAVFFAVQPLKQHLQHEVASQDGNGHEYCKRHLRLLAREGWSPLVPAA